MNPWLSTRIQAAWHALAERYQWSLAGDNAQLERFIAAATPAPEALDEPGLRNLIIQWYNQQLYGGLQRREEAAARELMLICLRVARSRATGEHEAQDIAAETTRRVIERLPAIKQQGMLIGYSLRVLASIVRERRANQQREPISDDAIGEPANPAQTAELIEQRLVNSAIVGMLRRKLANEREFIVTVRVILLGEQPRDVAASLGIPLHQARLAKSRALQRLRNDPECLAFCRSLIDHEQ
ncbi:MAG TPA: hypothetical protein VGE07_21435 [Herpetosiphonaceae bacterium]